MEFTRYQKQQINAEAAWKTRRTVLLLLVTMLTLPVMIFLAAVNLGDLIGRKPRINQNEKIAIESLGDITVAQSIYYQRTNEYGTFDQLREMGLIDRSFHGETPQRSGYVFQMSVRRGHDRSDAAFSLIADPANTGFLSGTGVRHFFVSSSDGVIRSNSAKAATESDDPITYY